MDNNSNTQKLFVNKPLQSVAIDTQKWEWIDENTQNMDNNNNNNNTQKLLVNKPLQSVVIDTQKWEWIDKNTQNMDK